MPFWIEPLYFIDQDGTLILPLRLPDRVIQCFINLLKCWSEHIRLTQFCHAASFARRGAFLKFLWKEFSIPVHQYDEKSIEGGYRGLFPAFHGKFYVFPAFRSFFSSVFWFSATFHYLLGDFRFSTAFQNCFPVSAVLKDSFSFSADILKFSGFPWLKNVIFQFPPHFLFPGFRRIFSPFPVFLHFFLHFSAFLPYI